MQPLERKAFSERINHAFKALFGSEVYSQSQPVQDKVKKEKPHGFSARCLGRPGAAGGSLPLPRAPPPPELGGSNPAFQHELEELDGAGQARESRSKSVQKWGAGTLPAPRPANAVLIMIIMLIKLTGWTGGELADGSS